MTPEAAAFPPVEIFAPGTHTAMSGKRFTFSDEEVAAIAANYDPALFASPAVIGHPKTEDPAFGWAKALRVEGGKLVADLEKVAPEFVEAVRDGRYTKVSAAFYAPDQAENPKPGSYYLRHIGFLGGAAPAVKGLTPVAFAEDDDFIEFATDADELRSVAWLARTVGRLARGIRDWLIEKEGEEAADRVISDWDADAPTEIAAELRIQASQKEAAKPAFAEGDPAKPESSTPADPATTALTEREAALAAREAKAAERDASFAERTRAEADAADAAAFDALVEAGRLAPGHKPHLLAFAAALDSDASITFAEGETPAPARAAFRDFLEKNLGQTIHFGEHAPGSGAVFAEGMDGEAIGAAIRQEMAAAEKAGQPITAAQAAARIKHA